MIELGSSTGSTRITGGGVRSAGETEGVAGATDGVTGAAGEAKGEAGATEGVEGEAKGETGSCLATGSGFGVWLGGGAKRDSAGGGDFPTAEGGRGGGPAEGRELAGTSTCWVTTTAGTSTIALTCWTC
ncbi:hypothetical protein [Luteolibacter rhizosphaerae]|uniref:hypothetical protein n=1 Tax=Luteolibacter rhizosphaerae TaxID=2989719 RepID=UPI0022219FD3|nr:hypothetical protein [Luteolibacter rhizosphaerae]